MRAPANSLRDTPTDVELLELVSLGDLGALGVLYDRYHRVLARLLYRLHRNHAEVDDLFQNTFLELPKIAHAFDGRRASCRSWLSGIAVRLALRHQRSFGRLVRRLGSFAQTRSHATTIDPEVTAGDREELRIFERALANLSPKKRAAFVIVELEGVAMDEAARMLEAPVATVRTRLFHAKQELRKAMSATW
jgi:RNA polymerase sigma-70 factor (ECF subfamily)